MFLDILYGNDRVMICLFGTAVIYITRLLHYFLDYAHVYCINLVCLKNYKVAHRFTGLVIMGMGVFGVSGLYNSIRFLFLILGLSTHT
jgi:hypothetical protein